ncbi:hypothetical protein O53_1841 [Microcystis aeruginosa TAIHU98]|uniref:Uncharacterized protein n=1 Tax=Microcystis aeruginosa TAIHU98 TaxID=1134457 RepID=L7EEU8_MICAE|nr:hypothetical protein O53_1841 [Microcystis aeruginosa TAIHU98]
MPFYNFKIFLCEIVTQKEITPFIVTLLGVIEVMITNKKAIAFKCR